MTSLTSAGVIYPDSSIQTTKGNGIRAGQTYAAKSRALWTTYTNSTTNPMYISVTTTVGTGYNGDVELFVDGVVIQGFAHNPDATGVQRYNTTAIVPPGSTYQVNANNMTILSWIELS